MSQLIITIILLRLICAVVQADHALRNLCIELNTTKWSFHRAFISSIHLTIKRRRRSGRAGMGVGRGSLLHKPLVMFKVYKKMI